MPIAHSGNEAFAALDAAQEAGTPIDLVLLDMNLPDLHGLDVARRVRGRGNTVDIIAITAVRDLNVVRTAISAGVTQYLIKPFGFAAFAEKLENYRQFRFNLGTTGPSASQASIDNAFAALRSVGPAPLPKGLIAETLGAIARDAALGERGALGHRGLRAAGPLPGHRPALPGAPGRDRSRLPRPRGTGPGAARSTNTAGATTGSPGCSAQPAGRRNGSSSSMTAGSSMVEGTA